MTDYTAFTLQQLNDQLAADDVSMAAVRADKEAVSAELVRRLSVSDQLAALSGGFSSEQVGAIASGLSDQQLLTVVEALNPTQQAALKTALGA